MRLAAASAAKTAAMKELTRLHADIEANSASGMSPGGRPMSISAPAKPKPCSRPKVKATTHGHRAVKLGSPRFNRTISLASKMMLSAIIASTGGPGTCRPQASPARG